jgi:hypothetical protein
LEQKMRNVILLCTVIVATGVYSGSASASVGSALQTFVSATGNDGNNCTQIAPCATFARAYSLTAPGGSILCLNSGQYATVPLFITMDVTIDCGAGNVGRMDLDTSSGTSMISISSGSAVNVTLRHLSISGNNRTGTTLSDTFDGIAVAIPAGSLTIEDSVIKDFSGNGINFTPSGSGRSSLTLSSTKVENNHAGVGVNPASGQITSVGFYHVGLGGNVGDGLDLGGAGITAGDMRSSVVANNGNNGIVGASAGGVFFTIEGSTISANLAIGIEAGSPAANLAVAHSTIGGNGTGIKAASGSLFSFGDNHISANGVNGSFTGKTPEQ